MPMKMLKKWSMNNFNNIDSKQWIICIHFLNILIVEKKNYGFSALSNYFTVQFLYYVLRVISVSNMWLKRGKLHEWHT